MAAPEEIVKAVAELAEKSGHKFAVTAVPVDGTQLYVVYAADHPFPDRYTVVSGMLGFRVSSNLPDACPEDSFFLSPDTVKLKQPDPVRNSTDIHRASSTQGFLKGTELGDARVLVFSWHVWNRPGAWNRKKHTLMDHYTHCLRRFEEPEHDR